MPFNVDAARADGISDDEIIQHLKSQNPSFNFESAINDGISLNEIANHLTTKGGEQNEVSKQSQPEANTDSNEQRQGNEQVQPSNEAGLQPSEVQLRQSQGQEQRVGNINANLSIDAPFQIGGENIAKENQQATKGSQGQEDGQGLRGQVPSGNEAQVSYEEETSVPSAVSKVIGGITAPLGYIGEGTWNAIAGIQRTLGFDKAAEDSAFIASQAVEDFATTFGGTPVEKGGAGEKAAKIAGALIELPALVGGSLIEGAVGGALATAGFGALIAKGYGESKEGLFNKYLEDGLTEEEANKKSTTHAAITTMAVLPAYYLGGRVAGAAADAFIAESATKLVETASRIGLNATANGVASAASRGFAAGLEGENVLDAIKDVSLEGSIQDVFFALHAQAVHVKEMEKQGRVKEALSELSDPLLEEYAKANPRSQALVDEEKAKREVDRLQKESEAVDLPETASVLEEAIQPTTRFSSEKKLTETATERLNELKAKPAEELTAEEATELDFLRRVPSTEELATGYGVSVRKPTYSSEEIIQSKIDDAATELESLSAKETLNQREAKRKTRLENEIQKNQELLDTGKTLEAETARREAGSSTNTEQTTAQEPPVQEGYVRLYHGGAGELKQGDKRWVSADRKYAEGYAEKSGSPVLYIDLPRSHPEVSKALESVYPKEYREMDLKAGIKQEFPVPNFELSEELTSKLQKTNETKVQEQETSGVSTEQGKPLVETTAIQTEEGTAQRQGEGQEEVAPTEPTAPKEVNSFAEATTPEEVDAFLNKNLEDAKLIQETKVRNKFVNDARKEAIARNKQLRAEAKQKPLVVTSLDNGSPRATPKKEKPLPKNPKGKRILAAAYKRPSDGQIFYGANHKEALLASGMSWKDVQSKYGNPSQRESPEFGYKTDSNEFVTRREAEQVGTISKQIDVAGREADKQLGLDLHSNRLSLDEFQAFKAPEFSMGAARPSEFGEKKAFQDTLVKGTQAHESIKGEVTFEKWKSAFLSGLNKGGQFTESQLKSIFQESEGLNAYAKSFGRNPEEIIDFPDLWSGKSATEIKNLSESKRDENIEATNDKIDNLRQELGYDPIMKKEAEKWGDTWKEAMLQINSDTGRITSLIKQIEVRPRALTPVETVILRYATLDALHTLDIETRNLASATNKIDKNKYAASYDEANLNLDKLLEIEYRTASASGSSLNARKLINDSQINESSMIRQMKAAKRYFQKVEGMTKDQLNEPLSPEESRKIRERSRALVEALKVSDEAVKEAKSIVDEKSISDFLESAKKDRQAGEVITDLSVDEQISQYTMEIETADTDSMNRGVAIRGLARAVSEKLNTTDVAKVSKAVHDRIVDIMGKEWTENNTKDALAGNGIFGQHTESGAKGSLRNAEKNRDRFEKELATAMKAKTLKERNLKLAKLLERNRVDVKHLEPQIEDQIEPMMTIISKLIGELKNNELRPCE
jgi:hypothetical protein